MNLQHVALMLSEAEKAAAQADLAGTMYFLREAASEVTREEAYEAVERLSVVNCLELH